MLVNNNIVHFSSIQNLCIQHTECICVFLVNQLLNSDYFPTLLYNRENECLQPEPTTTVKHNACRVRFDISKANKRDKISSYDQPRKY
jgi:hypothetical protein